ncbi:MFS transporter [Candidatus Synechococcus calcipolaris G9]|uniref:MFS transporter n=1 Tax=Candidatus Synechococcus calcipolaris G9 TaxID=1497997 RepID=A0ABT6EZC4_9SYNE|nr:MFS transporter [Candidatus Synechococcus calcipolaris]MDG2990939.1 MFS transporter [Candidatus Synechococcus calcipolaris G9]
MLGLVGVQGSITLAWVIYALYLPDLLVSLGFSKSLAGLLLLVEHGLEAVIEPIFGHLSDLSQRTRGSRFPWIRLGVSLAAILFILLPLVTLIFGPDQFGRWLLPGLAVLWASVMAIFRSPVMALLGQATPRPKLPIAASGLTFIQQLVGAFRFTAYGAILSLGPVLTFAIGSGVLAGAAVILRRVTPNTPPHPRSIESLPLMSGRVAIAILGTGISLGLALRFLFASVSKLFALRLGADAVGGSLLGFSLILALSALPAGQIASRMGNSKATIIGLGSTALFLALSLMTTAKVLFILGAIALGITFSLALNGMIPFVLETTPNHRSGLGMGLYFGGFSGAIGLFDFGFAQMTDLQPIIGAGILCFILASGFVFLGHSSQTR